MAESRSLPVSAPGPPLDAEWGLVRWLTAGLLVCLALTLVFIIGVSSWGVAQDLNQVRQTLLESQMQRLRSHSVRTMGMVLDRLRRDRAGGLAQLRTNPGLRRHWKESVLSEEPWLYSAIVDAAGTVVVHSEEQYEGKRLGDTWYSKVVSDPGDDVVLTAAPALTGGLLAYDVHIPIYLDGVRVGALHNGLDAAWFEAELARKRAGAVRTWAWALAGITAAVLAGGFFLYQIGRRLVLLRERHRLAQVRRYAEIGQLVAGIAHEIRNPLNALRLNLHVLGRQLELGTTMDVPPLLHDANAEIERVERLMRVLLSYARPGQPHVETLDVRHELQATLSFLRPMLEQAEVAVRARLPETPLLVRIDRDRLRQILMNLINNAREATGPGGQIQVTLTEEAGTLNLIVADDGPGIPPAERERVFEPFYSTKENGTGLGLALVRRSMDEIGGTVRCEPNTPRGTCIRLRFPTAPAASAPANPELSRPEIGL